MDIPTLESSRLELEHCLTSSEYERKKSHLEVEFVHFLAQLHPPKYFSTLTPRDIVHFLIRKDKDAKNADPQGWLPALWIFTQGHAFKTVDFLIGQIRALLGDHRTTIYSPLDTSLPDPALHPIVKRYLKALTEEQLQARVLPQQAKPLFVHDLMILCSKIERLLKDRSVDLTHVFLYARDLAYFKLHFFSGDRPLDLSHIRTEEIMRFPGDKVCYATTFWENFTFRGLQCVRNTTTP